MNAEELMPKQFVHQDAEKRIFRLWEEFDIFSAKVDENKKPFCVVIPPPNVTGILHMGHVLDNVPQDIMTRWHRMRGFSAVWIPGTDHAGIATQSVVKRALDKEGIKIADLGREEFIKRVWAWKEKSGSTIVEQLKRLGCSCDWKRERFTMDPGMVKAVLTAFVRYYERGLIYRGKRMINWCTVCGTALADDEVEHSEHKSHLWHFRYPIARDDGSDSGDVVIVATTRPETMLGDTAVAVHPADGRYTHLVGKKVRLPLQGTLIPIIADDVLVDPKFGTGVVKLTPAHDPNDYAASQRHKLEIITVIGEDGRMTQAAGAAYIGLHKDKAREKVVADLEAGGFVEKIEKHNHAVGECYRCKSVVEPLISDQWFVKMAPLAEKAKAAVLDGRITIVPESEKHDYMHWMDTIRDWCISRQLWWGHRIPVYYCDACKHPTVRVESPDACEKCGAKSLTQDSDVLDTWFSSQLWPFGTLGWPEETPELKYWYPNSWLMSGRDILFFWDARMIMSGLELVGDVPFRALVLHGLVRDSQGRKLSKSLNNSPDPIELFDKYGTDAIRAAVSLNYPMGRQDTKLIDQLYTNGQSLIIKLWNASRLFLGNVSAGEVTFDSRNLELTTIEDKWIVSRMHETIEQHDAYLTKNDLVHAAQSVIQFFWNEYCDWYLEIIKSRLWGDAETKRDVLLVTAHCTRTILKLLHPYIPFVTEELWQTFRRNNVSDTSATGDERCVALASWPQASDFPFDASTERSMDQMMSLVRGVRDVRAHLVIPPKADLRVKLQFFDENASKTFESVSSIALQLGFIKEFTSNEGTAIPAGHVPCKFAGGIAYVSLPSSIDASDLGQKLTAKIDKLAKTLSGIQANLANEAFLANAPAALVDETRQKEAEMKEAVDKLSQFKESLGKN